MISVCYVLISFFITALIIAYPPLCRTFFHPVSYTASKQKGLIAVTDFIVIELDLRRLKFYQNGRLKYTFPIAVGKNHTPSPAGNWYVINKKIMPEPGVFGTRWIGLSNPGYGIHGTNSPDFIGTAISMGCIRMHNADIEKLFPEVSIGTPVIIAP